MNSREKTNTHVKITPGFLSIQLENETVTLFKLGGNVMSSHGREKVDKEVLDLQNDIKMKARFSYSEFWGLVKI